ncbi:MAG: sigma-54-dependent Fis family transcriptional regulator [Deltaproteobacteria bacterium]|nr:sigma-54-dependent Fis family transcriptional regulator [Deltaproteobacteria bacterium]MCW5803169.1 sigma-54-dependent Fis family transcriptional regulator [Deltaproteobacteria bacterium]
MVEDAHEAHAKVMVVEDDPEVSRAIARKLGGDGYDLELTDDPKVVLARLDAGDAEWDVMILDVGLPGMSGIDVLHRFREAGSVVSVLMLTGDNTATTATECMRAGAFYYLTKPFRPFELASMVESAARYARLRRQLHEKKRAALDDTTDPLLVGTSAPMRKMRAAIARLANQDVSVLIQGESGTGKELVARALHERGPRREHRFVALNCGAIPESLIDSELFGHAKGAFTGATTDRAGVFVEADGGTLFLDEIGDMPLGVQARLLRVLQESEVRPVGASGVRKVDVRVIAATHVELNTAVTEGRFRQDLFYRLNVVVMPVPPLRERLDDLPLLAGHFLRKHTARGERGAPATVLAPETLEAMAAYHWPGNVRELENALLHAVALHHGETIRPEALPFHATGRVKGTLPMPVVKGENEEELPLTEAKRRAMTKYEHDYLVRVMERAKGSVSEAARLSGLDRTNFRRLLQRHGIDPTTYK